MKGPSHADRGSHVHSISAGYLVDNVHVISSRLCTELIPYGLHKWSRCMLFWIKGPADTDASALGRPTRSGSGPAIDWARHCSHPCTRNGQGYF